MGDRTTVTLTVLKSQEAAAAAVFGEDTYDDLSDNSAYPHLAVFTFYEVNYGDLNRNPPWLDQLKDLGIAYESQWDSGSEYGPGFESCRFTKDGKAIEKSISDEYINPSLSKLLELIDDYAALKEYIQNHHEKVTVLPWDNQEEYGKLYRAKQLISS